MPRYRDQEFVALLRDIDNPMPAALGIHCIVDVAVADRALVPMALCSFAERDATPQGQTMAAQPLMKIARFDDAPLPTCSRKATAQAD